MKISSWGGILGREVNCSFWGVVGGANVLLGLSWGTGVNCGVKTLSWRVILGRGVKNSFGGARVVSEFCKMIFGSEVNWGAFPRGREVETSSWGVI